MKKLLIKLVKLFGWKLLLPEKGTRPEMEHCVFVTAPHTSWLDFPVGATYLWSCCSNGKVLMKKEFFFWPLGSLLRKLGVISVDRGNRNNKIVERVAEEFSNNESFSLALTPEGTRKRTKRWKRGFWEIARAANVPIVPTYIDYKKKEIGAFDAIKASNDYDADLKKIQSLYRAEMARYPEDFQELQD